MDILLFRPAMVGMFAAVLCLHAVPDDALAQSQSQDRPAATGKPGDAGGGAQRRDGENGAQRRGGGEGRPTFVTVDEVTRGEQMETRPVYGRVIAQQAGVVASRVRGAVGEIRAFVGSRVKKGDVLIVLLIDMLRSERALKAAELEEFRARIRTSEAQLRLSEQELQRIERLRSSAAFSAARYEDKRRDVERFRSAMAESTARAKQAEAELDIADINLANAVIRAPYDGVVTQRHTETGAYVNVGDRVVTMTNDFALEIEAEVPAVHLGGLLPGTRITVDPETAPAFHVAVRAVVPEENQLTRTRTVRFSPVAANGELSLAANQSVILLIPAGETRTVITAHKDALLHRRGASVMFVYADGKVAQRNIVIGEAYGTRFEIVSGLEPGEMVVTRGNERLRPGQPVQIRRAGLSGKRSGSKRDTEARNAAVSSAVRTE